MIRELERQARPWLWGGFLGSVAANIFTVGHLSGGSALVTISAMAFVLACSAIFIRGCALYARAKGQSPWFGAFALLGLIGIIVLAVLPDKHKDGLVPDPNRPQIPTLPPPPPYHPGEVD